MNTKAKTTSKSRKEIRQAQWQAERRRKQLRNRAILFLGGVAVVAFVGYLIWNEVRPKPGQSVPLLQAVHIALGAAHEPYNSDPPTSGPHDAKPASAGFYDTTLADETLVHNLEHGYVVIWYNCTQLDDAGCQTLKTQIKNVMDRAKPVTLAGTAKKLIAVTRPNMDTLIALTSWGRIDKLTSFNDAEIGEFINDFRNKSPEPDAP